MGSYPHPRQDLGEEKLVQQKTAVGVMPKRFFETILSLEKLIYL